MKLFNKNKNTVKTKTIYLKDFTNIANVITYKCGKNSAQEFADKIILGNMIDYDGILYIDLTIPIGISSSFLQNTFGDLKFILTKEEISRIKIISNNKTTTYSANKFLLGE